MLQQTVTIINKYGLHTRAAAKLVATATKFESKIEITYRGQIANCKSIMALITLGLKKGSLFELLIQGSDELVAQQAIITLINNRFDEKD